LMISCTIIIRQSEIPGCVGLRAKWREMPFRPHVLRCACARVHAHSRTFGICARRARRLQFEQRVRAGGCSLNQTDTRLRGQRSTAGACFLACAGNTGGVLGKIATRHYSTLRDETARSLGERILSAREIGKSCRHHRRRRRRRRRWRRALETDDMSSYRYIWQTWRRDARLFPNALLNSP